MLSTGNEALLKIRQNSVQLLTRSILPPPPGGGGDTTATTGSSSGGGGGGGGGTSTTETPQQQDAAATATALATRMERHIHSSTTLSRHHGDRGGDRHGVRHLGQGDLDPQWDREAYTTRVRALYENLRRNPTLRIRLWSSEWTPEFMAGCDIAALATSEQLERDLEVKQETLRLEVIRHPIDPHDLAKTSKANYLLD